MPGRVSTPSSACVLEATSATPAPLCVHKINFAQSLTANPPATLDTYYGDYTYQYTTDFRWTNGVRFPVGNKLPTSNIASFKLPTYTMKGE